MPHKGPVFPNFNRQCQVKVVVTAGRDGNYWQSPCPWKVPKSGGQLNIFGTYQNLKEPLRNNDFPQGWEGSVLEERLLKRKQLSLSFQASLDWHLPVCPGNMFHGMFPLRQVTFTRQFNGRTSFTPLFWVMSSRTNLITRRQHHLSNVLPWSREIIHF